MLQSVLELTKGSAFHSALELKEGSAFTLTTRLLSAPRCGRWKGGEGRREEQEGRKEETRRERRRNQTRKHVAWREERRGTC